MTSITFFFFLIPVLGIVLLAVNFIFATHTPYQEKNSAFECGFHSFLGQNRMQFNISFYIFGLLFLLFDLEILLIYPYPVSAYFNSLYGLSIMLIFFLVLTLGFAFELGKNALKIDSRQYDDKSISYITKNPLEAKFMSFNNKFVVFFIILYIYIRFNIDIIYCTGPEEEPIDADYLRDQIYSIQETIRENGLNKPDKDLSKESLDLKKECRAVLRETIRDLTQLKEGSSKADLDTAKRTADSIADINENISNKRQS